MAVEAIEKALKSAGIDRHDIDLVISACGVGYQTLPSTAPVVMAKLDLADGSATAFDVNSTCLSFLTGIETAHKLLQSGNHKTALVFSSEIATRALPWETDPNTAALFGDGAAAVILGYEDDVGQGLVASVMKTYPTAYEACSIAAGGTRFDFHKQNEEFKSHTMFNMDGKSLFRITRKYFSSVFEELLEKACWRKQDVDVVIPHQASPFALQHMIKATGLNCNQVVNISQSYGNQIAASIPFTFDYALKSGKITNGSKVLFIGTAAGVSIGGVAWEM